MVSITHRDLASCFSSSSVSEATLVSGLLLLVTLLVGFCLSQMDAVYTQKYTNIS